MTTPSRTRVETRSQLTELLNSARSGEEPQRIPSEEQLEVVHLLLTGKDVRYVDRTGAGKSETYFAAAKLMRRTDNKAGPVIVITPLNALMADQVKRATDAQLKAGRMNKDTSKMERDTLMGMIKRNELDLLFLTPEMINTANASTDSHAIHRAPQFKKAYKPNTATSEQYAWTYVPLVVIDELHYISTVGFTFRKQYRLIWAELQGYSWFTGARKLGLTATFNAAVREDIINSVAGFASWSAVEGPVFRDNISIRVVNNIPNTPARDRWMIDFVTQVQPRHNILVFAQSIDDCERYLKLLQPLDDRVAIHHAKLSAEERQTTENDFRGGRLRVLISTKTLSLGFDKKDIHDVVHLYTPPSTVQYCQEIGRAGRDHTIKACAWLLCTAPWNSDGWHNALTSVTRHLSLCTAQTDSKSNVEDMLYSNTAYSSRMRAEALEVGLAHEVLVEKDATISFSAGWMNKLAAMKSFVEGQKAEMGAMRKLNTNRQCCWDLLLKQFEQTLPAGDDCCRNCSYPGCKDTSEDYIDNTQVDSSAGDSVFYRTVTPAGFEVYGLANTSDRVVDLDLVRVQRVLTLHVPGVYMSPPSCAVAYVPGRSKDNAANMKYMAEQLNLGLMREYARVKSGFTGSSRTMKSEEAKQQLVGEKYEIDPEAILRAYAGQQVILYDDVVCSGLTFDQLANPLKKKGFHVIGLVGKIWTWGGREAVQFTIVDNDSEDADMDQEREGQTDEGDEKETSSTQSVK